MLRTIRRRFHGVSDVRGPLSALIDDPRLELWPRLCLLRYFAAALVAVGLALEVEPQHVGWALVLPFVGIVVCLPVQRLAQRDRRWGTGLLLIDCIGLSVTALVLPEFYPLCIAVLVGSLALISTASGERWLRIAVASSIPFLSASVAFRSPPHGLPLLLIIVLSLLSFTITSRQLRHNVDRTRTEFIELINSLDLAFWLAYRNDDVPHTIIGELGRPVGRTNDFYADAARWRNEIHPDDLALADRASAQSEAGVNHVARYRERHVDGTFRWLEDTVTVQADATGKVVGTRGVRRDITESVANRAQAQQFKHFVEALEQAVMLVRVEPGPALRALSTNAAMRAFWGLDSESRGDLDGYFARRVAGTPAEQNILRLRKAIIEGRRLQEEFDLTLPSRDPKVVSIMVVPLPDDVVAVVLTDVTDGVMARRELVRRATTDQLTGLANRVEFHDRLRAALLDREHQPITIILLDLDNFKNVNDSFGHHRGDDLLVAVTQRMSAHLPDGATLARLGGDEFAVLLRSGDTTADAIALAHQFTNAFNEGIVLDGTLTLHVGASMGVASAPEHAETVETLIARADVAMYLAKRTGGGHAIYDPQSDTSSARRVLLLGDLRRALGTGEIICHFRPVVDVVSAYVGAEALVRWQHPDLGLIMPGEFVELAEVTSLSEPLAMTVLRQSLLQLATLRTVGIDLQLSINLTAGNLMNTVFTEEMCRTISAAKLGQGALTVEINERSLTGRLAMMLPSLHKLRELGVHIALDDFGAGQTSLALLRTLPLDELKIDKVLVDDLAAGNEAVVRSIIDLAHQLGLDVTAEGVEDEHTMRRLIAIGCDRIQGYHISRPMSGTDLLGLLRVER